ncbi:MAG: asparagine synthase (glutamine-hydrolyzing) [Nitrososphaerota archaeon]|nr:asparagine synthase (glutamine-hydrolyzing) [Nitrososphaerota archaeon]
MCGIGGCLGVHASDDLLKRMSALIKHRGPDDSGFFLDKNVGLFSDRLSIIDIVGGHQPMTSEDNLVIVFNGEIYNFPQLRLDLEKHGHRFKTHSDTEVILHGFEEYDTEVFRLLDGMFAIALYDITKKRLVLARDRIGIKPLYYMKTKRGDLVFCSEIKGILSHPEVSAAVNPEALYYLISLYYVPFDSTLFSGIMKIPAGHFFDSQTGKVAEYWRPKAQIKDDVPGVHQIHDALESSVKRQLISDVEVGAFLSGGLDTSTITAFASKQYAGKLKTFCMGFGHNDDELEDAKLVAEYFGTDHHSFSISDSKMLELYPKMIWHSELPKVNTYSWFVNQYASKFVKVCLSGLGGDELFFGYPTSSRYASFFRAQNIMKAPAASVLSVFASGKKKRILKNIKDRTTTYLTTISPIYETRDAQVFSTDISQYRNELHERMRTSFFSDNNDFVQQAVNAEFQTKLPDDFLSIDDTMSMAHSLENRVPLLDNELVDLVQPIPYRYNYSNGVGKLLLRKAMQDILPEQCFAKPKHGFSLNVVNWWSGEFGEEIRRIIPESAIIRQYFDVEYLRRMITEKEDYSTISLLWYIYGFHVWHETFSKQFGPRR